MQIFNMLYNEHSIVSIMHHTNQDTDQEIPLRPEQTVVLRPPGPLARCKTEHHCLHEQAQDQSLYPTSGHELACIAAFGPGF